MRAAISTKPPRTFLLKRTRTQSKIVKRVVLIKRQVAATIAMTVIPGGFGFEPIRVKSNIHRS